MLTVGHRDLDHFVRTAMCRAGAGEREAAQVAEVLVAADLRGVDSHGVARLRRYVDGLRAGTIRAGVPPQVVAETPATAALDAGNGLGQPATFAAVELAIAKARAGAVGVVTVRNSNHFGIAGHYAGLGARAGMFTMVCTNASPQVAPTHGGEPMFGTNPLAIALPTDDERPFLFDAATSAVPRGKLERFEREGRPMPAGWAVDPHGRPETDIPSLVDGLKRRKGYALLPLGGAGEEFGGHKGYGLGLLVDLLCGPFAGADWGRHVYGPQGAGLGHFVLCVRVDAFGPPERFRAAATAMFAELRSARKAPGQHRIYTPGEKEYEMAELRRRDGIPLLPPVVDDLGAIAATLGIAAPQSQTTVPTGGPTDRGRS
jgi:LDH2 family malate/lactate/ureidoglycolate dehydrogenase